MTETKNGGPAVDRVVPGDKWVFDEAVTDAFDDMLRRSIPDYDVMRQTVFDVGSCFVTEQTSVVDLGCSRGEALAPFVERFGAHNSFIGVEVSKPMLAAAANRFRGLIDCGIVKLHDRDLRSFYPPVKASLTLLVLTLQFVPINHRQAILRKAFERTVPGGALILVEKVLGADAVIDELMVARYHRLKEDNGYSAEDVARKAASLEGVLVPVTAAWNEDLLRQAGFASIDCIWRRLSFAGWVAVKSK